MEAVASAGALQPLSILSILKNRNGTYSEPFTRERFIRNSTQMIKRKDGEFIQHISAKKYLNNFNFSNTSKVNRSMIPSEPGIYLIYSLITKRAYVGKSTNMKRRLAEHERLFRQNIHKNSYLQNTYNLYSGTVFNVYPLEIVKDKDNLPAQEIYWSKVYEVFGKDGFNFAPIKPGEKGRDEYGDANKGENNGCAKLTEKQVIEICHYLNQGEVSLSELAREYRVSTNNIMQIRDGKKWGYLTKDHLNLEDLLSKKRQVKKLSSRELIDICFRLNKNEPIVPMAKEFGITRQAIYNIRSGKKNKTIAAKYLSQRIKNDWNKA